MSYHRRTMNGGILPVIHSHDSRRERDYTRQSLFKASKKTVYDKNPHNPVSIEAAQRRVLTITAQTQLRIEKFQSAYRSCEINFERCRAAAIDAMKSLVGYSETERETGEEFKPSGSNKKIKSKIRKQSDKDLQLFCNKSADFKTVMYQAETQINEAFYGLLLKYCVSFIDEPEADTLPSVKQYEKKVQDYENKLATKLKKLSDMIGTIREIEKSSPVTFLTEGPRVNDIMDESCLVALEICGHMHHWCADDRRLPAKLWEEISRGNVEKRLVVEEMRKRQRKIHEMEQNLAHRQISRAKVLHHVDENKRERYKIRNRKVTVDEKLQRFETELNRDYGLMEENEMQLKNRKSNSPRLLDIMSSRSENLMEAIRKLSENRDTMRRHMQRLESEENEYTNVIELYEKDLQGRELEISVLKDKIGELQDQQDLLEKSVREKESKIGTAKKIRQLKLAATPLKKIYYQTAGIQVAKPDILGEACRFVANQIGDAWTLLYQNISFSPARSQTKREHDLQILYITSLHQDKTTQHQALKSLEKWRVFNRSANIYQLIRALHKVEMQQLAELVQAKFVKPKTT